jgi:REP element-mobilizing transposase RayT
MKGDDGTTPVEGPVGPVPSPGAGNSVGRVPPHGVPVPSHGVPVLQPNHAGSGDPAYKVGLPPGGEDGPVGRVPPHGVPVMQLNHAGSGDPAYNAVGGEPLPRRLRRLHRAWPDRDGNISYFLTVCVEGRARVLDNQLTFARLVSFLCESPERYHWFGRRFVIMPDHIHLIAHMGHDAIRLGQWAKAMKAVVGGLERREKRPVRSPGLQRTTPNPAGSGDPAYNAGPPPGVDRSVGRVPSHGVPMSQSNNAGSGDPAYNAVGGHEFTRIKRAWRWQEGFHDHKFRTPGSEQRKWEYVCLNPVRAGLVKRPEEWPFGGEIFYDEAGGPRLVRGTPSLFETGMLIEEDDGTTPVEGNRPTT